MRSLLFVPGDSEKKQLKAAGSGADALILDLEDSVALSAKERARRMTRDYLDGAGTDGQKIIVRINALDTPFWQDDIAAVAGGRPHALMIPKTLSGLCVAKVAAELDRLETEQGLTPGAIGLCCVATETATSLFHMQSYAGASARLIALTWGAEDLAANLGARDNKDDEGVYTGPYQLARTLTLLAAVHADVSPIDTISKEFRDEAALVRETRAAARDGFTGKMAIHPAQVGPINEVFTPGADDLAHAHAVLAAFDEAGDVGVVALDGVMLDRPHLRQAQKLIERATQRPKQGGNSK
ncbi:MAG: CoA ester lyase [Parvibaculaceae bacterium]|nr:CoA ester lyase [Parvibaculaceae bacterium]